MYFNLVVESRLDAPGSKVWEVLKDFGGHYRFNPLMELSPISNGIHEGLGAEREVRLYDGSVIRQTIIDLQEGEWLLIGTTQFDLPIKQATTRYSIEPVDQPFCHVRIEVTYEPNYGPLGAIFGVFLKPSLRSRYNMVLRGLRHYLTTGQTVADTVPSPSG